MENGRLLERLRRFYVVEGVFPGWLWTAVLVAVLIAAGMVPRGWTGNEVNYFDLSLHFVSPGAFGDDYAATDHSDARFLSFALIGGAVKLLGFEAAHVVLRLAMIGVLGLAFAFMADRLGFARLETLAALAAFLLAKQALAGGEWIFGGVEAKTFAYAAIFCGIGCAWSGRRWTAVGLAALATYFHFLVGGFWGGAIVVLIGLRAGSARAALGPLAAFAALCLPLGLVILSEQGSSGLIADGMTADQIYARFRNPHHIAPFLSPEFFRRHWMIGMIKVMASAVLVGLCAWRRPNRYAIWLVGLNVYALLAFGVAYLDRESCVLAPFYMFRPSSLTLLLTLLAVLRWLRTAAPAGARSRAVALALLALVAAWGARVPPAVIKSFAAPELAARLRPAERDLVSWVRTHTEPDAVLLVGPWRQGWSDETRAPLVGFERLAGRPTLVNYKFVPTRKDEIVRWYELLRWRDEVFAGDCHRLVRQRVDYLVVLAAEAVGRMSRCGEVVWRSPEGAVIRVAPEALRAEHDDGIEVR